MKVRLAFAVAAHLEPDILIVDEVLAVGDAEFQKKAIGKMQDISGTDGRTVLFVSHNMAAVKNLCTRGVLLENGAIKTIGDIEVVLNEYQINKMSQKEYLGKKTKKDYYISSAKIINKNNSFYSNEDVNINIIVVRNKQEIKNKFLLVRVLGNLDQVLFSCEKALKLKDDNYSLTIPKKTLVKGTYKINCIIYHPAVTQYDNVRECCSFSILNNSNEFSHLETFDIGKLYVPSQWLN
jgi:lipopolysaccharide transport system ATP-binding protein